MKTKILFDASPLANGNKTGVGMYTQRLISALAASNTEDLELIGYYYNFLGRKKPDLPAAPNITYKPIKFYPGQLVNLLRRFGVNVPVEVLAKARGNVALYPNFIAQPSLFKIPSYAVLHDLSYITHPEFASDKNRKDLERFVPKTVKRCKGIITVSEVSKSLIAQTYGFPPKNILVTPIPPEKMLELSASKSKELAQKLGITKPYILYLGTLEPRKNLISLLEAYETSKVLQDHYQLVLAGGTDWKFEEILQKIKTMQAKGLQVLHCGYVSLDERAALYQEASVFVLPSHEEGFGMPILEAMQYSTPVAVSNIPVFHEVAGSAAVYFDQNKPADIADKLQTLLADKKLQSNLLSNASGILKRTDWQKVAKSVLDFTK